MLQILNDQSTNYIPNDTGYYKEDIVLVNQRRPQQFVVGAGERLKKCRKALGLSQITICEKLGVTQGNYSQWESGRQLIDPLIAVTLLQKFGVTLDYIYSGKEDTLPKALKDKI
jgi:DNA-binding XRE family transcriptional regulator